MYFPQVAEDLRVSPVRASARAGRWLPLLAAMPVPEVRAMWVQRGSLTSPPAIISAVETAKDAGFNTLIVQVRGRGDAYYNSRHEPRPALLAKQPASFDPLELIVSSARIAPDLKVHAWVNVNLVSDAQPPAARKHLVYTHPEWLMVPRPLAADLGRMNPRDPQYLRRLSEYAKARSDRVEGIFLSPVHKGAVDHITRVIGDIASRYDVDGIHLDYIRFPNDEFDYSAEALDEFRSDVTVDGYQAPSAVSMPSRARGRPLFYTEMFPQRWQEFRRARLTALLTRIRAAVKCAPVARDADRRRVSRRGRRDEPALSGLGRLAARRACSMRSVRWPIRPIPRCSARKSRTSNSSRAAVPCGRASARISSLRLPRSRTSARRGSSVPRASCCFPTTTSTADTSRPLRRRRSRRERFRPRRRVVQRGVEDACVSSRGRRSGHARARCCGSRRSAALDYDPDSAPTQNDTIFDLASLTKVIATTSLVMRLVERGALALERPDPEVDSRMARARSRRRDAAIAADAQLGSHRVAALLSRSCGPAGVSARDLFASARVPARHAVDLQRSRVHPARVHRRRCRRAIRSGAGRRSC